jgi:hypothetical protein
MIRRALKGIKIFIFIYIFEISWYLIDIKGKKMQVASGHYMWEEDRSKTTSLVLRCLGTRVVAQAMSIEKQRMFQGPTFFHNKNMP